MGCTSRSTHEMLRIASARLSLRHQRFGIYSWSSVILVRISLLSVSDRNRPIVILSYLSGAGFVKLGYN
ncbi:Uncharacterized protein HZ326_23214 [Fusarium oxysporum f. sp. albedinis]|nr:Uncharacterized protein HZ326_23214 [Fusarium oxysporum f. sp. albedinis]